METARFACVGLAGTAIYAIFAYGGLWSGWSAFWAHVLGSIVSLVFSYAAQKIFTFRIRGDHKRSAPRFVIATIIIVVLHTALVWILDHLGVAPRITLLAGILFYPPASYLLHKFWTFRPSA